MARTGLTGPARSAIAGLILALSLGAAGCGQSPGPGAGTDQPANAAADAAADGAAAQRRPNLLLIVADDLGFSDIGAFGGEIPTPRLDALAAGGMMLTQFYADMTCSPTRSMLMSGTDAHIAGLGIMGAARSGPQAGAPGYEGVLNFDVVSLPQLLKDAGYHTYMAGKWHLGKEVETSPVARGFEHAFASFDGAAHLGGLSWGGPGLAPYWDDEEVVNVGDDFYSTKYYTERMIQYIDESHGDGKPFFAWFAPTAPHWPLQAPKESIAKFKGRYDDGYEALHDSRLERSKELGLFPDDFVAEGPVDGEPAWEDLSGEDKRLNARYMEIYAAMVSDLDTYIGMLIDHLDSIGELDNTFILFMSDNGAEPGKAARFSRWIEQCCDNSFDNLGAGNSYVMYGPNWARDGGAPYRRQKFTAFEGGIHVPAFVNFPGRVAAGTRNDIVGTAMDVMPTFLELAGVDHPAPLYKGRTVEPMQGRSLLPEFFGTGDLHDDEYWFGVELYGHRMIRQGDWKIVWDAAAPDGERGWQLFNVADDPAEQFDLSAQEPERFKAMQKLWHQYERNNGVILTRGLNTTPDPEATDATTAK
jgi:arylsulfatase A-like enzyme